MMSNPDSGYSAQDHYRSEKQQINQTYDNELKNKSIFSSTAFIEQKRKAALSKLENDHYPQNGYGGFTDL